MLHPASKPRRIKKLGRILEFLQKALGFVAAVHGVGKANSLIPFRGTAADFAGKGLHPCHSQGEFWERKGDGTLLVALTMPQGTSEGEGSSGESLNHTDG